MADFTGKETEYLQVRLSTNLKEQFKAVCKEDEIDMSDQVRLLIRDLVRARQQPTAQQSQSADQLAA